MSDSQAWSPQFQKSRRLRRKAEFDRVFEHGQRGRGRFLTLVVAVRRDEPGPRLGIIASRKVGDSVHRNRAKRLIREIFRHNPPPRGAGSVDIVVIPRTEIFDAPYTTLQDDYRLQLARCAARLRKP